MNRYNCTIIISDECINNGNCKECEYGERVCDKMNLISKVDEYIEYTNDLTREMDNYLKHKSKYGQTYIMKVQKIRDRYYSAIRCSVATRGHIEVDDNNVIIDIKLCTKLSTDKIYEYNVRDIFEKYIGMKLVFK